MLLNQTVVAVDEELEKVIIAIDTSTETDFGGYESGYEYSSGESTEPPVKKRHVYSLDECMLIRMLKISWIYIDHNEIWWNLIKIIEYEITKIQLMLKQQRYKNTKKNIKKNM